MSMVNTFPPYTSLVSALETLYEYDEVQEWRYCYAGGHLFREEYLERYSDLEETTDFNRRKRLTPIPTFAKSAIHKVRNALAQGLKEVERRGGLQLWMRLIAGEQGGVNRHGLSMDAFIVQELLAEMLVMARVGALVDAPTLPAGASQADVPPGFGPYLNPYRREDYKAWPSDPGQKSEFKAVILRDRMVEFDLRTVTEKEQISYRYYEILENRGGLVNVTLLNESGEPTNVIETELTEIPFVSFDIRQSLMQDAAPHQITLLNLTSSDSASGIDSNHPTLIRQRGQDNAGAHLIGADKNATTGVRKGLWYDRGADPPAYIAPPVGPISTSISLRQELKNEIGEMVLGSLTSLGADGSPEAGLQFIGSVLASGEAKLWRYWNEYQPIVQSRSNAITVSYPDSWSLKTDTDRITEAEQILDIGRKLPGQEPQKSALRWAAHRLFHGKVSSSELKKILESIETAPFTTSDRDTIIKAKEAGLVSTETGSQALGFNAGEGEKAKQDQAERAAAIVAAQSDANRGAARGAPDLSDDPNSNRMAREGDKETAAKLGGDNQPGVRGEGQDNASQ